MTAICSGCGESCECTHLRDTVYGDEMYLCADCYVLANDMLGIEEDENLEEVTDEVDGGNAGDVRG